MSLGLVEIYGHFGYHGYNRSLFSALLDIVNVHTNLAFVLFCLIYLTSRLMCLQARGWGCSCKLNCWFAKDGLEVQRNFDASPRRFYTKRPPGLTALD